MHNIKLSDGTELNNLELNGNNYISDNIIDDAVFKNNLDMVTTTDTDANSSVEYKNMKLIQNKVINNKSWFILAEKTEDELEKENLGQQLSEREIQEIIQGQQISDLEIRLIMGGL